MATLAETVRSVQAQDFSDYEQLFVDGNSTDGTLDYLRTLPGQVRIIEGATGGISRAMNVGIREARGEYICHLHSDDYFASPAVLSLVAQAFAKSGARWLFGRCITDVDGQRISGRYKVPRYTYALNLKRNYIPHPATFVARSLFEECGGFDERIRYAMDYDLWLRLGKRAEPFQMEEELAVFRDHAGSLSSANRLQAFEDDWQVRKRHIPPLPWLRFYHWLHYVVRRRRLLAALAGGSR
jgi:glycosyltransferase involved in cell wall biosynthesis